MSFEKATAYPCFKSFDEFIDVERLRAMNGCLTETIERRIKEKNDEYFLNAHPLNVSDKSKYGPREIWLTKPKADVLAQTLDAYNDIDVSENWEFTDAIADFSTLMQFVESLPFEATGRILIIYDNAQTVVPAHRDHLNKDVCHEFIWFRTNLTKPFYMLNPYEDKKLYVSSYSAWFDSVNQYHGADAAEGLTFSIRVDGHFTKQFKSLMPSVTENLASLPAVWANASTEYIKQVYA